MLKSSKRIVWITLVLLLVCVPFAMGATSSAPFTTDAVLSLRADSLSGTVSGTLKDGTEVVGQKVTLSYAPHIADGIFYLPLQDVVNILDGVCQVDGKTATARLFDGEVTYFANSSEVLYNGAPWVLSDYLHPYGDWSTELSAEQFHTVVLNGVFYIPLEYAEPLYHGGADWKLPIQTPRENAVILGRYLAEDTSLAEISVVEGEMFPKLPSSLQAEFQRAAVLVDPYGDKNFEMALYKKKGVSVYVLSKAPDEAEIGQICGIEVTDSSYATPRGLRVGDSVERATFLYGTLTAIGMGDVYRPYNPLGLVYQFNFQVENDVITKIGVYGRYGDIRLGSQFETIPEAPIENDPYAPSAWAKDGIEQWEALGLLSAMEGTYQSAISRGHFAEAAVSVVALEFDSQLQAYLKIMKYRNYSETGIYGGLHALDMAQRLAILRGREDGDLDTKSSITRQEAAVMLARTYRAYHEKEPETLQPLSYADKREIADWALADVQLMTQLGIMNGVENNRFDPQGSYTVEQCYLTLVRLHKNVPNDGSKQENPFAIPEIEGSFVKNWDIESDIPFSVETKDYYVYAWTSGATPGGSTYHIEIIDKKLNTRCYGTGVLASANCLRGERYARPENASLSKDGCTLSYTVTLGDDVYYNGFRDQGPPIQRKGIYKVTMDLKTGEQTYIRAELTET